MHNKDLKVTGFHGDNSDNTLKKWHMSIKYTTNFKIDDISNKTLVIVIKLQNKISAKFGK